MAVFMKLTMETPGISTGTESQEQSFARPVLGFHTDQVFSQKGDASAGDLKAVFPASAAANVLLPDPLGPIMA